MTEKEEYLFMGRIKRKAIERKRITPEEIEKIIEISFNHGYNASKGQLFNHSLGENEE